MIKRKKKMNTKRILVSFLVIASVLFLASTLSALPLATTSSLNVKVNDVTVASGSLTPITVPVSVNGGDTVTVQVQFTSAADASNVKLKAELSGQNVDVIASTASFDVLNASTYTKTLSFKVPTENLKNDLTDNLNLDLKISNSALDTEINNIALVLQRPSYDVSIKSVIVDSTVSAGENFPVDVVLKNTGYNDLSNLYVTVSIPELNIQKSAYFGDLVAQDLSSNSENDKVSVTGRIYLDVPYNVQSGAYTLDVKAGNDDANAELKQPLTVSNGVPGLAMGSGNVLTLLNPSNQLQVYTVKYLDQTVNVVMSPASSKDVTLTIPSGDYKFDATVYSGNTLLSTVNFSGTSQSSTPTLTSPVLVLTVILAIVFVVLLVVLVVLITRKPAKAEEFGESYY